eukprot:scaffold103439_cov94-Attheya_sp.AAC.1
MLDLALSAQQQQAYTSRREPCSILSEVISCTTSGAGGQHYAPCLVALAPMVAMVAKNSEVKKTWCVMIIPNFLAKQSSDSHSLDKAANFWIWIIARPCSTN